MLFLTSTNQRVNRFHFLADNSFVSLVSTARVDANHVSGRTRSKSRSKSRSRLE